MEHWKTREFSSEDFSAFKLLLEELDEYHCANPRKTPIRGPRREMKIENLVVSKGFQRRGAGRALVAAALDVARTWAAQEVILDLWAFNESAAEFYGRLGFGKKLERLSRSL